MSPGSVSPPLSREEILSLLARCEELANSGEDNVSVSTEDLCNLCERLRTLLQIEDGISFLKEVKK